MEYFNSRKDVSIPHAAYNDAFWNAMRGKTTSLSDLEGGRDSQTGTYWPPLKTASSFSGALKEQSLFRRIGTVMRSTPHAAAVHLQPVSMFLVSDPGKTRFRILTFTTNLYRSWKKQLMSSDNLTKP